MRGAIAAYAAIAWLILWGADRLWPAWPMHVAAIAAGILVAVLALLAWIAAGRR